MILHTLRFAGFEWKHNPIKLSVDKKRTVKSLTLSHSRESVHSLTRKVSLIKGEGELVGLDCLEQYGKLTELFEKKEKGLLIIPGLEPFEAYFTALTCSANQVAGVVRYEFEFTSDASFLKEREKVHISNGTETIFDIAYDHCCDLTELVKLNPHLRRGDEIEEGERVILC